MIAFWIPKVSWGIILALGWSLPSFANPQITIDDYRTNQARVKLVVTVEENGEPVANLNRDDFQLLVDGGPLTLQTVSTLESGSTPTNLIILLDTSNSMESRDGSGKTRKDGAIEAIRRLQSTFANTPVQVKFIPFGADGKGCQNLRSSVPDPIQRQLASGFFAIDSNELTDELTRWQRQTFCTSTDLYTPLIDTLKYLRDEIDNLSLEPGELPPRYAVILLSDGFHSHTPSSGRSSTELFQDLQTIAEDVREVPVYTIGYGLSGTQLQTLMRREFGVYDPPLDAQEFRSTFVDHPNYETVAKQFLDHRSLEKISGVNRGGEYQSFEQADAIAETFERFVRSILGKYHLTYVQEPAEEGGKYQVQVISPKLGNQNSNIVSVELDQWAFTQLEPMQLLIASLLGLCGMSTWLSVFLAWSERLK